MKQLLLILGLLAASSLPSSKAAEKSPAPEKPAAAAQSPQLLVVTSMGNFTIELNAERAPLTVASFLNYVDQGHYTNTIVHRVVANFVVQMGGFDTDYKPRPAPTKVPNESGNGLSNVRGTVGLARTQDPHGGNAQFYINIADNAALDPNQTRWGYAVFGKVVSGMEIVDRISNVATGAHGIMKEEVPVKQIVVLKIERVPSS
jgi:cyclophilin family peptidyl-prolyl cis-trans isomerase